MSIKVTIEAGTMDEFDAVVRRLAGQQVERPKGKPDVPLPKTAAEVAERWAKFWQGRSDGQKKVIEVLTNAGGRMPLRQLEAETGLAVSSMSGTVGSLQRSSKAELGEQLIEAGPWLQNNSGQWDREYVLNDKLVGPE